MKEKIQKREYPIPLTYKKMPQVATQKELIANRKQDFLDHENNKFNSEEKHKDEIVRLIEREHERIDQLRIRHLDLMEKKGITQTKTKKILEAERLAQTALETSKKNDKEKSGIHPVKLPHFYQSIPVKLSAKDSERSKSQS